MFRHIRWRIAFPFIALILTIMVLLIIYLSDFVRDVYQENLQTRLYAQARLIADAITAAVPSLPPAMLDERIDYYAQIIGMRVTLIAPNGVVWGDSHEDWAVMENHLYRPEVQQALTQGQGSSIRYSNTLRSDMMYVAVPMRVNSRVIAVLRLSMSLDEINKQINRLHQVVFLVGLAATLLTVLLALFIADLIAQPLHRLTLMAERMAQGHMDVHLLSVTRDEVGQLAHAFNEMATQLRARIKDLNAETIRLSAVLDHIASGVFITDQEGLVQLINPAAASLLQTSPQVALGRTVAQVARHHELIELWQHCRESGQEQMAVVEMGVQGIFLQVLVQPFQSDDAPGYLFLLQDLTRLRHLETIRRDLISNISHELRTPLAGIKALVETLRDGALQDPPAAQRFLDRMETEVDALTQMLEELLELSRIESGKMPLRLRPVDIADLIHETRQRLEPQAERTDLDVTVDLPTDLPPVLAEPERIQQVLTNLLHNAIKFTPNGGHIFISADVQGDQLQVAVRDTGIGILPDDLPRIFERFYKADRSRSGGGTGLGLAIAKHIVQAHGGRIWAVSPWIDPETQRRRQGSIFYFTLPLAGVAAQGSSKDR